MSKIAKKITAEELSILTVKIENHKITAEISDGRIVSVPCTWFSRLAQATPQQIQNFKISPSGYGIHWPDLDEDISIKSFLF